MRNKNHLILIIALILILTACSPASPAKEAETRSAQTGLRVLAVESFLTDIAQNVAGDRLRIDTLIPNGIDPHAFEATPQDAARIADSDMIIMNGAGLEEWLEEIIANSGGEFVVIEASAGLESRVTANESEPQDEHGHEGDPHFWLDPNLVIQYVENIRAGLAAADPQGAPDYARNANQYIEKLEALDQWIQSELEQVPEENRKLITNHESLGYFADRYGFEVIGTIVSSSSSSASPSAQQLAGLIDAVRSSGAPAIFLETGTSTELAEQIASETGVQVVTGLYTHSTTAPDGDAPTYLDMMRRNTEKFVAALK